MYGESGESREGENVVGAGTGRSDTERLGWERSRELIPEKR